MILFSGTNWCPPCIKLRTGLLAQSDVRQYITRHSVPLYVHVPPFSKWTAAYRQSLSDTFPCIAEKRLGGVPSFRFTDAGFRTLKPEITLKSRSLEGLQDALKRANDRLRQGALSASVQPATGSHSNSADSNVERGSGNPGGRHFPIRSND